MLLSYDTDTLMPPTEAAELAATLGGLGRARVHFEEVRCLRFVFVSACLGA